MIHGQIESRGLLYRYSVDTDPNEELDILVNNLFLEIAKKRHSKLYYEIRNKILELNKEKIYESNQ